MMEKQFKPVPDVECLKYHGTPEKPDIKIFVSHRIDQDSETIDNPLYIPVRCGAVYDDREGIAMLGDDTGDNISEKRMSYCELTVQYWAWKNVKADYYGICGSQQYFVFESDSWRIDRDKRRDAIIREPQLNQKCLEKYGLKNVDRAIKKIKTAAIVLQKEQYYPCNNLNRFKEDRSKVCFEDVNKCKIALLELYPQMAQFMKDYLESNVAIANYSFIMRKDIFEEYSEFLFSVLQAAAKNIDTEKYTLENQDTYKELATILLGVFLRAKRAEGVSVEEEYIVEFTDNEVKDIEPAFDNGITVILSSSNFFVPYLATCIYSILETTSQENNYDILVIEREITKENKKYLLEMVKGYKNVALRFFNVNKRMSTINFYVNSERLSQETYYGLLMPWILPQYRKAIIMDCDMIVRRDIAELYNEELGECIGGGVNDVVLQGWLNDPLNDTYKYYTKDLRILDPFRCFNGGLILLDFDKYREAVDIDEVLNYINHYRLRVVDQDIFNILLEGKTKLIDVRWNHMIYLIGAVSESIRNAPAKAQKRYFDAQKEPYIIHFASENKPWINPEVEFAAEFWRCARQTPFYEVILLRMMQQRTCQQVVPVQADTRSGARKFADEVLPKGSRRRAFAKRILPKGSRRWNFCKKIYYKLGGK